MRTQLTNSDIIMLRDRGYTFQEIADEAGITRQRAHFIYHRDKKVEKPLPFFTRLINKLKGG